MNACINCKYSFSSDCFCSARHDTTGILKCTCKIEYFCRKNIVGYDHITGKNFYGNCDFNKEGNCKYFICKGCDNTGIIKFLWFKWQCPCLISNKKKEVK